jgi:antirestriction protein ArdC
MPFNAASGHRYQGINPLLLWRASHVKGYRHPGWIGYQQARERGGYVRKGEKATLVVYASTFTPKEDWGKAEEDQRKIPFLKWRDVFNVEQTANLPASMTSLPDPRPLSEAIAGVDVFLRTIGARVVHGGDRAAYSPVLDRIVLPEPGDFKSAPDYYATSLHEHVHWTGHESRLNRDLSGRFGDASYAAEELVAELGAAYLSATLSIPGKLQHAEYIGNWITLLHHDSRAIFTAASKGAEAARYLEEKGGLGGKEGETEENGEK